MFDLLRSLNATVTCCHSKTENLPQVVYEADILVVAIRQARYIKKEWVKPGAVVIDAGINSIPGDLWRKGEPVGGSALVALFLYNNYYFYILGVGP